MTRLLRGTDTVPTVVPHPRDSDRGAFGGGGCKPSKQLPAAVGGPTMGGGRRGVTLGVEDFQPIPTTTLASAEML